MLGSLEWLAVTFPPGVNYAPTSNRGQGQIAGAVQPLSRILHRAAGGERALVLHPSILVLHPARNTAAHSRFSLTSALCLTSLRSSEVFASQPRRDPPPLPVCRLAGSARWHESVAQSPSCAGTAGARGGSAQLTLERLSAQIPPPAAAFWDGVSHSSPNPGALSWRMWGFGEDLQGVVWFDC